MQNPFLLSLALRFLSSFFSFYSAVFNFLIFIPSITFTSVVSSLTICNIPLTVISFMFHSVPLCSYLLSVSYLSAYISYLSLNIHLYFFPSYCFSFAEKWKRFFVWYINPIFLSFSGLISVSLSICTRLSLVFVILFSLFVFTLQPLRLYLCVLLIYHLANLSTEVVVSGPDKIDVLDLSQTK